VKKSIFEPIKQEGLTTLLIRYDWKTDKSLLYAAKEWNDDIDFSKYNKDFYATSLLTDSPVYLGDKEVRELYRRNNLEEYLNEVIDLLRKGKHFGIQCFYYKKKDIRYMNCQHSVVYGLNNKLHSIMSGGIRRHGFQDVEIDVIIDGLNLSRAMSFKNVAAAVPAGGTKTAVHANPIDLEDMDEIGFYSYALDRTRCFTGPDMNFPIEMADVMNQNFSNAITGGPKGPLGSTGIPTAYGVYLSVKQAAKFKLGSDSLKGVKIAVQGLGQVGYPTAEHFLNEGANLIVADNNETPIKMLKERYPNQVESVDIKEILFVEADIFSPAAVGGIFTDETIPELKFKVVVGGANNQLKASGQDEEYRLAKKLAERDILFLVDWVVNIGGVMGGWEEYLNGNKASKDNFHPELEKRTTQGVWEIFSRAKELGITPTEYAYKTIEAIIYK